MFLFLSLSLFFLSFFFIFFQWETNGKNVEPAFPKRGVFFIFNFLAQVIRPRLGVHGTT